MNSNCLSYRNVTDCSTRAKDSPWDSTRRAQSTQGSAEENNRQKENRLNEKEGRFKYSFRVLLLRFRFLCGSSAPSASSALKPRVLLAFFCPRDPCQKVLNGGALAVNHLISAG